MNVGVTGHQGLTAQTARDVRLELRRQLGGLVGLRGVSSLAAGADQLFAEVVLEVGGDLTAVVPSRDYANGFRGAALQGYERLLGQASEAIALPFEHGNEESYWAAGQEVVRRSDRLIAVWDGQPAGGLGGTGDVVDFARQGNVRVDVIWPVGAKRG